MALGSHHCKTAFSCVLPFSRNSHTPGAIEYHGNADLEPGGVPTAGCGGGVVNSFWENDIAVLVAALLSEIEGCEGV